MNIRILVRAALLAAVVLVTVACGAEHDAKSNAESLSKTAQASLMINSILATEQAKLLVDDDVAGDEFGFSVAISGNMAIVGAPKDDENGINSGSAYLFERTNDVWSTVRRFLPNDGAANDRFGCSVAIDGYNVLVGAVGDDNKGSAYVFQQDTGVWYQTAKFVASDGVTSDYFGQSIALAGSIALVGAWGHDVGASVDRGAAYVFVENGSYVWSEQAKLTASDGAAGYAFGYSVALLNTTALVGAPHGNGQSQGSGTAYLFGRDNGIWSEHQKLVVNTGNTSLFGHSVALSGNTALVGAPNNGEFYEGWAYVFVNDGLDVWSNQASLWNPEFNAGSKFGGSVALSGDTAIVGAAYDDDLDTGVDTGSAFVFTRSGGTWTQQSKMVATDKAISDDFGYAVAISGNTTIVGAIQHDHLDTNAGAVYTFAPNGPSWQPQQELIAQDQAYDNVGSSVALSGDTALVGTCDGSYDVTANCSAYVFVRSGGIWVFQAKLVPSDTTANSRFGISVALSGDTAIVGAESYGNSVGAYVFVRSGATWTEQATLVTGELETFLLFRHSVALSGDTALVGAYNGGGDFDPAVGSAYVFTRSNGTWTQQGPRLEPNGGSYDGFGYTVALAGNTAFVSGWNAAYVFVQNGGVWMEKQILVANGALDGDAFGSHLAVSGDSLLVGAPGRADNGYQSGAAYVFMRDANAVWTEQQKLLAINGQAMEHFGCSVAIDGTTALVGAYGNADKGVDSGAVVLFELNGSTWVEQQKIFPIEGAAHDLFGYSVALSGNHAIAGAPWDDDRGAESGAAYVFVLARGNGALCNSYTECQSGFCADGVCCDSLCTGPCFACTATVKGYGADGICEFVAKDKPPASPSECPGVAAEFCGLNGLCAGNGTCQQWPPNTLCSTSTVCSNDKQYGFSCNGFGSCVQNALGSDCAPYVCGANACSSGCTMNGDCAVGNYCAPDSSCKTQVVLGSVCASPSECASGFCQDGVCCNSPCNGLCQACSNALKGSGADGYCGNVQDGTDPHDNCTDSRTVDPTSCLTTGLCGGGQCQIYEYGASCGKSVCHGSVRDEQICNGLGSCVPDPSTSLPCAPFACADGACKAACVKDVDCALGFQCSNENGHCTPVGAECSSLNDHTLNTADGNQHDCTPYICKGDKCKEVCSSVNDCVAPSVCDTVSNKCVAAVATGGNVGDCGCRVPGTNPNGTGWPVVIAVGVVICWRRRFKRRSLPTPHRKLLAARIY